MAEGSRVMALWFPDWSLQRRGISLTYRIDRRQRRVVAQVAEHLRRRGIVPGMSLAEAESIIGSIRAAGEDREGDQAAWAELASWCESWLPVLEREAGGGEDSDPRREETLFAVTTHVAVYFGGEHALLRRVAREAACRGYQVRAAIASSREAARSVAFAAPARLNVVPPWPADQPPPRLLAELPVGALHWPAETERQFRRLGLRTLGELLAIPSDALGVRLGLDVVRRLERLRVDGMACGERVVRPSEDKVVWCSPDGTGTTSRMRLEPILHSLCGDLACRLARTERGVWGLELTLRGEVEGGGRVAHSWPIRLAEPTADAEHWFALCRRLLERTAWKGAIDQIELKGIGAVRLVSTPGDLFSGAAARSTSSGISRRRLREAARWIERLSACLGPGAVCQARPVIDVAPERQWEEVAPRCEGRSGRSRARRTDWHEPLYRLVPPRRMAVVSDASDHGLLHSIRLDGRPPLLVVRQWGPARRETGWWRGELIRRRYYWLETEDGFRWSVFHCLRCKRWYWHGWE